MEITTMHKISAILVAAAAAFTLGSAVSTSAYAAGDGTPKVIPHPIDSYVPITADKNACLGCHQLAKDEKGAKTQIPLSHQENGKVAQMRWNCTMCHMPQQK
jgi:nitrate reductase cytochrome c-type subunit